MGSREENSDRGDDCEQREEDQANAIHHHSSELPIVVGVLIFFVFFNFIRNNSQFLQYAR